MSKLSAILSVFRHAVVHAGILLALLAPAWAEQFPCGPPPRILGELEKATAAAAAPADFDQRLAPLLVLRHRYPEDLWVNERYQDAVQQYGIEGHLRKLTEEYQVLAMQHSDDLVFGYLYARTLMGRNTAAAIEQMTEIIAARPDFAPAHRSLAEIYGTSAFHDEAKEKVERERFLALCPGSKLQQRPAPLPGPSGLIDQGESMLAQNGNPDRAVAIALQGIRADESRLQRIRPFDWYSVDFKRQAQRELQASYWRLWSLQVRCQRRAGRPEKAAELLDVMEQRASALRKSSDVVYWDALSMMVRLYAEGNQKDLATQKLDSMQQFLAGHPDAEHSAQMDRLRKLAEMQRP